MLERSNDRHHKKCSPRPSSGVGREGNNLTSINTVLRNLTDAKRTCPKKGYKNEFNFVTWNVLQVY
jgi:hypothetical protein